MIDGIPHGPFVPKRIFDWRNKDMVKPMDKPSLWDCDLVESAKSEKVTVKYIDFDCQEKVCGCDMVLTTKMAD